MKRFIYLFVVALTVLATSCNQEELFDKATPPSLPGGKTNITITGDGVVGTRSTSGRVEFTGGYATGGGLYDSKADVVVQAVPYDGYELASFNGGPVNGSPNQFTGSSRYGFNIESQDWQFNVSFVKKEYTITVNSDGNGTVSGGGTIPEGENCSVSAYANGGYTFDGWYEGSTKVSSSSSYSFTVSSNRTMTAKFVENVIPDVPGKKTFVVSLSVADMTDDFLKFKVKVSPAAEEDYLTVRWNLSLVYNVTDYNWEKYFFKQCGVEIRKGETEVYYSISKSEVDEHDTDKVKIKNFKDLSGFCLNGNTNDNYVYELRDTNY